MTADPITYDDHADYDDEPAALPPWMKALSPEAREAVRRNVATAPPLSRRQQERLRLLFRKKDPTTAA